MVQKSEAESQVRQVRRQTRRRCDGRRTFAPVWGSANSLVALTPLQPRC